MKPFNPFKTYCLVLLLIAFTAHCNAKNLPEMPSKACNISKSKYAMTASDQCKFLWFRVAKVGTRSFLSIFSEANIPLSLNCDSQYYDKGKYKDYFKFAFVRNPWDRVVSCYCNKVTNKAHRAFAECFDKDFEYFVDFINRQDLAKADRHIRLQVKLFPMDEVDFIGRFENFEVDLKHVLNIIGIDSTKKIPQNNPSKHMHYSHYYNERTKKIIAKKYKPDIKAFNYAFENEIQ